MHTQLNVEQLLDTLAARHKSLLRWYVAALVAAGAFMYLYGPCWLNSLVAIASGHPPESDCPAASVADVSMMIACFILAPQLLFLWGGGRIKSVSRRVRIHTLALPLVISSITVLAAGFFTCHGLFVLLDRNEGRRGDELVTKLFHHLTLASLLENPRTFLVTLVGAVAITATVLFWRMRKVDRVAALSRLAAICLICIWVAVTVLVIAQPIAIYYHDKELDNSNPFDFDLFANVTPVFVGSTFCPLFLLGSLGSWVYLLRLRMRPETSSEEQKKEALPDSSKSSGYIASASNIAIWILVAALFGIIQASTYTTRLDKLMRLRTALAQDLIYGMCNHDDAYLKWITSPGSGNKWAISPDSGDLEKFIYSQESYLRSVLPWATISVLPLDSQGDNLRFEVQVTEDATGYTWHAGVNLHYLRTLSLKTSGLSLVWKATTPQVLTQAAQMGMTPGKDEDSSSLYLRAEHDLLESEMSIPGSGLSFPRTQIVWICLLAIIVSLLLLHDRISNVLKQPLSGSSEPFLLSDAQNVFVQWLSRIWLLGLFIAPYFFVTLIMRLVALLVRTAGGESSLRQDALVAAFLVLCMLMCNFFSLSAISSILTLRKRESTRLESKTAINFE